MDVKIQRLLLCLIFNVMFATVRPQGSKSKAKTTNATTPTTTTQNRLVSVFNDLRKQKSTKDADLVIKMTADFITDMQQKMYQIKRIERSYSDSADFITGTVYDDIQRRFKHMCDLYKQFATVDRYVFGTNLNRTAPGVDVVVVFQIMLSDYNEILMLMELFKIEQLGWKAGVDNLKSRDLIQKQMEKFGNLPSDVSPPSLHDEATVTTKGPMKQPPKRRWAFGRGGDYPMKWSGELDGVGFDNR